MPAPTLVAGAPCWIDLYSSDTDKATKFYGDLLGWTARAAGGGLRRVLHVYTKDGKARRRMHAQRRVDGLPGRVGRPSHDRRRRATAKATPEHGGSVELGPMEVAENGQLRDDQGSGRLDHRRLAAEPDEGLRADRRARHAGVVRAAHGRLRAGGRLLPRRVRLGRARDERHGRLPLHDARRGRRSSSPGSWTTRPRREPSGWNVYFAVDDVDAALGTVEELGGRSLAPAEDTPVRPARDRAPTRPARRSALATSGPIAGHSAARARTADEEQCQTRSSSAYAWAVGAKSARLSLTGHSV